MPNFVIRFYRCDFGHVLGLVADQESRMDRRAIARLLAGRAGSEHMVGWRGDGVAGAGGVGPIVVWIVCAAGLVVQLIGAEIVISAQVQRSLGQASPISA